MWRGIRGCLTRVANAIGARIKIVPTAAVPTRLCAWPASQGTSGQATVATYALRIATYAFTWMPKMDRSAIYLRTSMPYQTANMFRHVRQAALCALIMLQTLARTVRTCIIT